ncbi:TenA family transcriptional regulator [Methylobacillus methanolivorans]|uniref:TenA family transcriptional regulator n=1 Tax=Methylobacillus methanolivorans TaxID=1848927 RepID=A0ABW8GKR5_9PROT
MAFYETLLQATQAERQALLSLPLIQAGAQGNVNKQAYIAFLGEAYHHVKHTVPLLMACGSRLPDAYEWLRTGMAEYIEEEVGHQAWILNDITACGGDAEAVRHGQPSHETELMVAYAYHLIDRKNPLGFLGMVLVLEGTSTALASLAATSIQSTLNLPKQAFSYLTSHGALDVGHTDFYAGLVNNITQQADRQAVIHGAKAFYRLYGDIFSELFRRFAPIFTEEQAA